MVGLKVGPAVRVMVRVAGSMLTVTSSEALRRYDTSLRSAAASVTRSWSVMVIDTDFILLFRITPGIPLSVQNYLLGLAEVDFTRYLLISLPVQSVYALAFVWFGHSLTGNATWRLVLGGAALVALVLAVSLLRRWLMRRRSGQPRPAGL